MSDWQKVRLTFQDADGNEVSAVVWQHGEDEARAFAPDKGYGPSLWLEWNIDCEGVSVTPIRELPTGVGAVIRVTDEWGTKGDPLNLFTLDAEGWWHGDSDAYRHEDVADWQYEILSEGIQIGDVK